MCSQKVPFQAISVALGRHYTESDLINQLIRTGMMGYLVPFRNVFTVHLFPGDEYRVVSTPPFAESVTEGDVKWEKGE